VLIQGNIPINIYSEKLQVNRLARKARHHKNFSKVNSIALKLSRVVNLPKFKTNKLQNREVSDTQIIKRALAFVGLFVVVTSFTPNIAFSDSEFTYDQMASGPMIASSNNIIADDSGFMIPVNPQTNEADRSEMSDMATHTVASGETLSTIAETYGIKTKTLMWENNLGTGSILKVGQELTIPPVDGVSHTVKSGQSLAKIAALYEVPEEDIIRQNALESETLAAGENLFIPGGELIAPVAPVIVDAAGRSTTAVRSSTTTRVNLENTTATPAVGKFLIYPTRGSITQGYYSWHLAVDIADRSKPPIWAAAGGTVVKASSGTWGGGYGTHVIIDHGNGVQTLYAHMDYLTVSEGQYVTQGEVIGRMGNTGRVYGVTGIHLHFEVRDHGIKQYPGNYW
jgi:murein DD-endopeptidase MepM/ murein hydrolase activator NlpD